MGFIALNGGRMQIASGKAFWQFQEDAEVFEELEHDFPGTIVNLEILTADNKSYSAENI